MNLLLICFSLFFAFSAQSQDIIIFNSGDTLECKIIGVNYVGIHTKTKEGRPVFEKDTVESYKYNNVWVQVAGPSVENGSKSIDMRVQQQMGASQNFEQSLNSAGSWLITGVVLSTLMIGGSLFIEDRDQAMPLLIAGGLIFPLSIIVAGSKLKRASREHKLIDLK